MAATVTDTRVVEFGRGFEKLLGLQVVEASADRVVAVVPVTGDLLQGHGIVHGGVYAAAVETCASLGAYLWLDGRGVPVGLSNHTEFVHAVHEGAELRAEALPLTRGRTTQLWQVEVADERGRLVAHGRVRLLNLEQSLGPGGVR